MELAFGFPIFSGILDSPRQIPWIPDFPKVKISLISEFLKWGDVVVQIIIGSLSKGVFERRT